MEPETFITRTSDTELTFAAAGTDLVRTREYTVFSLTRLRISSAFLVVRACVFFFCFVADLVCACNMDVLRWLMHTLSKRHT